MPGPLAFRASDYSFEFASSDGNVLEIARPLGEAFIRPSTAPSPSPLSNSNPKSAYNNGLAENTNNFNPSLASSVSLLKNIIQSPPYTIGSTSNGIVAGILGVLHLRLGRYLLLITKAERVGYIPISTSNSLSQVQSSGHAIYKIKKVDILPLREVHIRDKDEEIYLSLIRSHINSAELYFSYTYDLTNSLQRQIQIQSNTHTRSKSSSRPNSAASNQPKTNNNTNAISGHLYPVSWQHADDRFFWNKFVCADLIQLSAQNTFALDAFVLPVINGFLEFKPMTIASYHGYFGIISRRSRFRAGTRYFTRGLDKNGNVANFNETEQIIVLNDSSNNENAYSEKQSNVKRIFSFLQIRGSVPVFWQEVNTLKYTPKIHIGEISAASEADPLSSATLTGSSTINLSSGRYHGMPKVPLDKLGIETTKLHFDKSKKVYGDVYCVNLVNSTGREQLVKAAYETAISALHDPSIKYIYFDFHKECSHMRWDRISHLIDILREKGFENSSPWFQARLDSSGELSVEKMQGSIVRTNCMDCLDRTNVVQSTIARYIIHLQLLSIGAVGNFMPSNTATKTPSTEPVGLSGANSSNKSSSYSLPLKAEADSQFEFLFRNVWADNGNITSRAYSGTGALKTDFTRTGKRTRKGALADLQNSITRYILNNFYDGARQDAYDLFLGVHDPFALPINQDGSATDIGSISLFDDNRSLIIQAIPYVIYSSILMLLIAVFLPRSDDARMPLRIFVIFWLLVLIYSLSYMSTHGSLFVDWPKLSPPDFVLSLTRSGLIRSRAQRAQVSERDNKIE